VNLPANEMIMKAQQQMSGLNINLQTNSNNSGSQNSSDHSRIQEIISAFCDIVRENPMGVHSADIIRKVSLKINYQFNAQDFGLSSILGFVTKYVLANGNTEHQKVMGTQDIEFV
jgi:hypothetical protein